MAPKSPADVMGFEFDWLASDAVGCVALFTTAGGGFAPPQFLANTVAHDSAIDLILELPPTTTTLLAPQLPSGFGNTWRLVAERGLFAFDSDPNGGPYRLVAVPAVAVRVTELPAPVTKVVLSLCSLRFANAKVVPAAVIAGCLAPPRFS